MHIKPIMWTAFFSNIDPPSIVFFAIEWWSFCHALHSPVTNATHLTICLDATAFVLFCTPLSCFKYMFAHHIPSHPISNMLFINR